MKMRKLRIAVAINDQGEYAAYGGSGAGWEHPADLARDALDSIDMDKNRPGIGNVMVHWVEASVPVPVPTKLRGKLKKKR